MNKSLSVILISVLFLIISSNFLIKTTNAQSGSEINLGFGQSSNATANINNTASFNAIHIRVHNNNKNNRNKHHHKYRSDNRS